MSDYMLELVIDGKTQRMMLVAMPTSVTARLYRLDRTETMTLLGERVLL